MKPHYSSVFNGGGKNCPSLFQSAWPALQWQTSVYASQLTSAWGRRGVEISGLVFGCNCPKSSGRKEHCNLPAIVFLPSVFALH